MNRLMLLVLGSRVSRGDRKGMSELVQKKYKVESRNEVVKLWCRTKKKPARRRKTLNVSSSLQVMLVDQA